MIGFQIILAPLRVTLRHVDDLEVLLLGHTPFGGELACHHVHHLRIGHILLDLAGHIELHDLVLRRHESCVDVGVVLLHRFLIHFLLLVAERFHLSVRLLRTFTILQQGCVQRFLERYIGRTKGFVFRLLAIDVLHARESRQRRNHFRYTLRRTNGFHVGVRIRRIVTARTLLNRLRPAPFFILCHQRQGQH